MNTSRKANPIELPMSEAAIYLTYHGKGSKELLTIRFDGGNKHA